MSQIIRFGDHFQFVVKEHWSSFLHWDLRLQLFGQTVLSFALRTSPHLDPTQPTPADRVADHKLAYMYLERIIPPGWPGAGPTALWDKGFFRVLGTESIVFQMAQGYLRLEIMGGRLKGIYSLKWIGPQEKNWSFTKEWDDFSDKSLRFPNVLTPDKIQELERKTHPSKNRVSTQLFFESLNDLAKEGINSFYNQPNPGK